MKSLQNFRPEFPRAPTAHSWKSHKFIHVCRLRGRQVFKQIGWENHPNWEFQLFRFPQPPFFQQFKRIPRGGAGRFYCRARGTIQDCRIILRGNGNKIDYFSAESTRYAEGNARSFKQFLHG